MVSSAEQVLRCHSLSGSLLAEFPLARLLDHSLFQELADKSNISPGQVKLALEDRALTIADCDAPEPQTLEQLLSSGICTGADAGRDSEKDAVPCKGRLQAPL